MTKIDQALTAVTDAATLLNVELIRTTGAPISGLDDAIGTLSRAVSRVQVLIAMHPELTREDPAPRGAIPDDELSEHADTIRALEEAFALPTEPARLMLRAHVRHDGTVEDLVREHLDGRHLLARPTPTGWYNVDVDALAEILAAALAVVSPGAGDDAAPDCEDDADLEEEAPTSEAVRDLRRRVMGPRAQE